MEKYRKYYIVAIFVYFLVLAGKYLGASELVYWGGDESHHFMNGVFIHDFVADGGWRAPFAYSKWYYLKYPALSVHQYPPLFYILEALLFALFGIRVVAVQILIFTVMGFSLYVWHRQLARRFSPEAAALTLLICLTAPLFLHNFARIMLDSISLALALLLLVALDRWRTSQNRRDLLLALLLLPIILLIAFTSYFLLFYLGVFLVDHKFSGQSAGKQWRAVLLAFLVIFLLFVTFGTIAKITGIPLLYRTFQGINMMTVDKLQKLFLTHNFAGLWRFELLKIFGAALLLPALMGLLFAARQKAWGKFANELLYAANFLFIFTLCLTHFEPGRFNLFLLPVFAVLAGYALDHLLKLLPGRARTLGFAGLALLLGWQGIAQSPQYLRGYEAAAQDVIARNPQNAPVLCDAYLDGNFIAAIRKYDPAKAQIIFRGDKLLFTSIIYYRDLKETYVHNAAELYDLLDRYGIRYIVVDGLFLEMPPKALLRQTLQDTAKFRRLRTYPLATNIPSYEHAQLELYEYAADHTNYAQPLKMAMPVMEANYTFTLDELRKPFAASRIKP